MRRIAIVGAGQVGIVLGAELLARGYSVSLISDRSPEAYLQEGGRPTACLFGDSVVRERELGLNFWEGQAPSIKRIHLDLCTPDRLIAFSVLGDIQPALAVDQRLKFSRGMQELEKRGAKLLIEEATLERSTISRRATISPWSRSAGSPLAMRSSRAIRSAPSTLSRSGTCSP
jgi:glycine/D-amino acid oxidase-like deaminating enzyme